ncbi:MAG: DNA-3-methyladenine glycosylase 2 family protein [Candidatus Saccharimonadales bacterium]
MTIDIAVATAHLAEHDPVMARLISDHPAPIFEKHPHYYRELMSSIISQQLSVKAAATIEQRFVGLFGHFPLPEEVLGTSIEEMRSIGLSRQKASYIIAIAEHARDFPDAFLKLDTLENEDIIRELTAIKGVGVWTVHMFLMFCIARLDVLPSGDLGIKRAIERAYDLPLLPTPEQVEALALQRNWHPYASVASRYLWLSLDNTPVSSTTDK